MKVTENYMPSELYKNDTVDTAHKCHIKCSRTGGIEICDLHEKYIYEDNIIFSEYSTNYTNLHTFIV